MLTCHLFSTHIASLQSQEGVLMLTATHIIFVEPKTNAETMVSTDSPPHAILSPASRHCDRRLSLLPVPTFCRQSIGVSFCAHFDVITDSECVHSHCGSGMLLVASVQIHHPQCCTAPSIIVVVTLRSWYWYVCST